MTETGYLLRLGDGSGWVIIATPDTRSWVEKFATIMKLEAKEQDRYCKWPRMFFFLKTSRKDGYPALINLIGSKTEEDFPRTGWKAHNLRSLRLWSHRAVPDIICEIGNESNHELDIIRMWTSLYFIYLPAQNSGGLPLHAALVELYGKGVLLVGPGGSGKSTSCRRILFPWRVLSEDQSLIVRNARKGYLAHPIPTWSDHLWQRTEQRCNIERYVRLAAIFFLEQAEFNEVVPINKEQAAVFLNHSSTDVHRAAWQNFSNEDERKLKMKIFDNSCKLAKAVTAYTLRISLNGRFWEEMEKVI